MHRISNYHCGLWFPFSPFFRRILREIGTSHFSPIENVASKYLEWENGGKAKSP